MSTTLHLGQGLMSPEFDLNDYSPYDPSATRTFSLCLPSNAARKDDEEAEDSTNVRGLLKARARKSMIAQTSGMSLFSPPPPLPAPPLTSLPTTVKTSIVPELPSNNVKEKVKMMEEILSAKPMTSRPSVYLSSKEREAISPDEHVYTKPRSRQQVPTAPASPASAWRPPPGDTFYPLHMASDSDGIVDRVIDHLVAGQGKRRLPPVPSPSPSTILPQAALSTTPIGQTSGFSDGDDETSEGQVEDIIDAYALFTASLNPTFPRLPSGMARSSLSLPASPIQSPPSLRLALPQHALHHLGSTSPATPSIQLTPSPARVPHTSYTPVFTPMALRPVHGDYLTPSVRSAHPLRTTRQFLDTPSGGMYDLFKQAMLGLGDDDLNGARLQRAISTRSVMRASRASGASTRKESIIRRKSERPTEESLRRSGSRSRFYRPLEPPPPLPTVAQAPSPSSSSSSSASSSSNYTTTPPAYAALTTNSPQDDAAGKKPILSKLNVDIPSSTLPRFHLHTPYRPRMSVRRSRRMSRRPSRRGRVSFYPSSAHPSSRPSLRLSPSPTRISVYPASAHPSIDRSSDSHPFAEYTAYEYIYTYIEGRDNRRHTQASAKVVVKSATLTTTFTPTLQTSSFTGSPSSSISVSFRVNRNRFGGDFSLVAGTVMAEFIGPHDEVVLSASAVGGIGLGHEWEDEVIVLRSADVEELREIDVTPTVSPVFLGNAPKGKVNASTGIRTPAPPLPPVPSTSNASISRAPSAKLKRGESIKRKRKPAPLPDPPSFANPVLTRSQARSEVERQLEGEWIKERARAARARLPPIPAAPTTPPPPLPPKEDTQPSMAPSVTTKFVEVWTPQTNGSAHPSCAISSSSLAMSSSSGSGSEVWHTVRDRLEGSMRRSPDSGKRVDGVIADVRTLLGQTHTPASTSGWTVQSTRSDSSSSSRRIGDKLKDIGLGKMLFGKKKEMFATSKRQQLLPEIPIGSPFMVFGEDLHKGPVTHREVVPLVLNTKDLAKVHKREMKERKEMEKREKKERKRREAEKQKKRAAFETSWDFLDGEYTPSPDTATMSAKFVVYSPRMIIGSPRLGMTAPINLSAPSPSSMATFSTYQQSTVSTASSRGRQVPFPVGARPLTRREGHERRGSDASEASMASNTTANSVRRMRRPGRNYAQVRGPPPNAPLPSVPASPLPSSSPYVL